MGDIIVAGEDCKTCYYGTIDNTNKARIKVHCDARDKTYCYGQYIPCEDYKKKGE